MFSLANMKRGQDLAEDKHLLQLMHLRAFRQVILKILWQKMHLSKNGKTIKLDQIQIRVHKYKYYMIFSSLPIAFCKKNWWQPWSLQCNNQSIDHCTFAYLLKFKEQILFGAVAFLVASIITIWLCVRIRGMLSKRYAPCDINSTPQAQSRGMCPEKTSFFETLQIPNRISRETIESLNFVHLIKTGESWCFWTE